MPAQAPADLPPILKTSEVAALLRVNRKTLYEAIKHEQIPGVIRVGRCLRFQRDVVLGWLGQGGVISGRKDP